MNEKTSGIHFLRVPKCSTCLRAQQYLDSLALPYTGRDLTEERPTAEELLHWARLAGTTPRQCMNTTSRSYRSLDLKRKREFLPDGEILRLMAGNEDLVRHPILVLESAGKAFFGFSPVEWGKVLLTMRPEYRNRPA